MVAMQILYMSNNSVKDWKEIDRLKGALRCENNHFVTTARMFLISPNRLHKARRADNGECAQTFDGTRQLLHISHSWTTQLKSTIEPTTLGVLVMTNYTALWVSWVLFTISFTCCFPRRCWAFAMAQEARWWDCPVCFCDIDIEPSSGVAINDEEKEMGRALFIAQLGA